MICCSFMWAPMPRKTLTGSKAQGGMCYNERHWGPGCVLLDSGAEGSSRKGYILRINICLVLQAVLGFYDHVILFKEQELFSVGILLTVG